jgi:hypothetical protein
MRNPVVRRETATIRLYIAMSFEHIAGSSVYLASVLLDFSAGNSRRDVA